MVQNSEDDNLNPKKPYLSDILNLDELHKGQANIIVAPCHSGKTTAAHAIMEHHARSPGNVLYLIDTRAGKDSLLLREKRRNALKPGCTFMIPIGGETAPTGSTSPS